MPERRPRPEHLQNEFLPGRDHRNQPYLLEEARVSSGAKVGSLDEFTQRQQTVRLRIEPGNVPGFMEAVQSEVERTLVESNARIVGSESDLDGSEHFSFSYQENGLYGTIHVWGVPGAEQTFTLITEN